MMSSAQNLASTPASPQLTAAGIFKGAALGGALGAAVNLALYFVASAASVPLVGEFVKGQPHVELAPAQVLIASLVPAFAAAVFTLVLARFVARPGRVLVVAAVLLTALSMGGPLSIPGASPALRVVLAAMHVVSALTITAGIVRVGRRT